MLKTIFPNTSTGFEITTGSINMANLFKSYSKIYCKYLNSTQLPNQGSFDIELLEEVVKPIKNSTKDKIDNAYLTLNCRDILIKKVNLPLMHNREIPLALKYELRVNSIIPWNIDEVVYDWVFDQKFSTHISVLLVAINKVYLNTIISTFEKADITLKGVEIEPLSNLRLLKFNSQFQLDEKRLYIILKRMGNSVSMTFTIGSRYLLTRLINLSGYSGIITDSDVKIKHEIDNSINYLQTVENIDQQNVNILLSGKEWTKVESFLGDTVSYNYILNCLTPFKHVKKNLETNSVNCDFSTVTGLALRRWFN